VAQNEYLSKIIAADNNTDKASEIARERVFLCHNVNLAEKYELASSYNSVWKYLSCEYNLNEHCMSLFFTRCIYINVISWTKEV